jgi:hypothetical protein
MKKLFALWVGLFFLLVPATFLWATVERIDGPKCGGVAAVIQGGSGTFYIQGIGVDLNTGLRTSNSALSARVVRKWNGSENARDGGNVAWGKIQIQVNASASAPVGNHIVYIKYLVGEDRFTVRVIAKARITGATVPTFSQPFYGNVDVKLTGTGLSGARVSRVLIKRDAYTPLLDSSGLEVPPLAYNVTYVTGLVNTATNTDTQVDVRLIFSPSLPRLIKATIEISLSGSGGCSGLPASYTLTLTAPQSGPNYVAAHTFDRSSYSLGMPVAITIRLDRPVTAPRIRPIQPGVPPRPIEETVYWAVIPNSAIQQGGASATPYDPNAHNNQITMSEGQQTKVITFLVTSCPGGARTQVIKFITWKPDPNNDTYPNRKESNFTTSCQP